MPVGKDDAGPRPRISTERSAQFDRHLGSRLAGQPAADHENGVATRRRRAAGKSGYVRIEAARSVVSVDIEGVSVETGDRRAGEPAAEGEDQPVVRETLPRPLAGNLAARKIDVRDLCLNAPYADRPQHLV